MREDILKARYYRKDGKGQPTEDWPGLCKRVAQAVASDEAEERQFFEVMVYGLFLPNTPALTNAGRPDFTLSACFVPKLANGVQNILNCIRDMALIQKMGGGTGFCFDDPDLPAQLPQQYRPTFLIRETHPDVSAVRGIMLDHADIRVVDSDEHFDGHMVEDNMCSIFSFEPLLAQPKFIGFSSLRPSGTRVSTTQGQASGPASFMKVWDDMIGFLRNPVTPCSTVRVFNSATEAIKQGSTRRGANMGVLRDEHPDVMEFVALKEREGELPNFNLSIALTDKFMTAVKEGSMWELKKPNGDVIAKVEARKLWNKIIHHAWLNGGAGAIFIDTMNRPNPTPHLGRYRATNPCGEQPLLEDEACVLGSINLSKMLHESPQVDWKKLADVVITAVTFLDNVVDKQHYPLKSIELTHKGNRKIGLGVMGWADLLLKLKINYASEQAVSLAKEVMAFITKTAETASMALAEGRGVFPNWKGSAWETRGIKIRNAAITTIAPTGTISIIAECSGGIEPNFAWESIRRHADREFPMLHPLYEEWLTDNGEAPLPDCFITAGEVPVSFHVKMQAAFQEYTHNAVSKTVNLPRDAKKEDVAEAYLLAYQLGCKGITVYRDGSIRNQVMQAAAKPTQNRISVSKAELTMKEVEPVKLSPVRDQKLVEISTPEGAMFVHITIIDGKPLEVFITTPVESKHDESYAVSARLLSTGLRCGIPVKRLLKQLEEANTKYGSLVSPNGAVIRAFRMLGLNGADESCPECKGVLVPEAGCMKCISCGYSRC